MGLKEDQCLNCNSTDLQYGDKDWHGDQFSQDVVCNTCGFEFRQWYTIVCNTCGFEFRQWYTIKFDGMTIIGEDGTNIDIE